MGASESLGWILQEPSPQAPQGLSWYCLPNYSRIRELWVSESRWQHLERLWWEPLRVWEEFCKSQAPRRPKA